MGLLQKRNRHATLRSCLEAALIGMIIGLIFFALNFKAEVKEEWPIVLPIWLLGCGALSALWEWQVPTAVADEPGQQDEPADDSDREAQDRKQSGEEIVKQIITQAGADADGPDIPDGDLVTAATDDLAPADLPDFPDSAVNIDFPDLPFPGPDF